VVKHFAVMHQAPVLLLAFSSGTLAKIESAGNRWFPERQAAQGADAMRMKLKQLVAVFVLMLPKVW